MKNKKFVLMILIIGIFLVGGGIVMYYQYLNSHFVTTDDARISTAVVNVTPQIAGKITSWNISEGDYVKSGSSLGMQDTGSVASSAATSVDALTQVGSLVIGKGDIVAPISGKIIKSYVQVGQIVSPGQTLAVIANTDDFYVSANIEETKINKIQIGQQVDITIDSLDGKKFVGKVAEIGQATTSTFAVLPSQNTNGNFTKVIQVIPIKIRFPDASNLPIVPGMSVEVKIHIKK